MADNAQEASDGQWLAESVAQIAAAAEDVHRSMDRIVELLQRAASRLASGAPVLDVVQQILAEDGRESRLAPTVAYQAFERSVTAYRAQTVRRLVDDERLTYTDVSRLIGVSRQMVARLYHAAGDDLPRAEIRTPLT